MQVDIATEGTLGKKLSISWTQDEVSTERSKVLKQLSANVKLPGFRPGKNNQSIIEKRYGEEATARAEETLANDGMRKAVTDHKLKPIGPIKHVDSKRENGFAVNFEFEVRPDVKLPDPKSVEVSKEDVAVDAKAVDDFVNGLARRSGTLSPLADNETLQEDDSITLTGKVSVDGAVARELHDFHHLVGAYPLLGTKAEDVIAMLKDKKAGVAVEFDTTLPESFAPKEFAGKAGKVSVTVQTANRNRAAVIDDAFAKQMGLDDVAKLREAVEGSLKSQKENALHQKQIAELEKTLLEKATLELPPALHKQIVDERTLAAVQQAEADKKSPEDIEKAKAEAITSAEAGLKRYIVIAAICDQFDVQVSREDIQSQIQMAAMRSGQTPDAIHKRLVDSGQVNQVVEEIREGKALESFLEKVLA